MNATRLRYIGRVSGMPGKDGYGFISLSSVEREDGASHDLSTKKDIFVHQDDCESILKPGVRLVFDVVERFGHPGEYRAVGASEYAETELVPASEPIQGFSRPMPFNTTTELALATTRLPVHQHMKSVPAETIAQVVANEPMPEVPRQSRNRTPEEKQAFLTAFLVHLFPNMESFSADFTIMEFSDEELDQKTEETNGDLIALGMDDHIARMRDEVTRFKAMRSAIRLLYDEDLVRPDTIIPIKYLPDLFMAVPVWFFWADQAGKAKAQEVQRKGDPRPHPNTLFFCDLFLRNKRWADTYQLFNRRTRTLDQYGGSGFDVITPKVARRMRKAVEVFDYVVIATPYHDLAGSDWNNLEWLRSIDPYVLGFKKGIPYFFVLARFSDSGTFPLFHVLLADTIEFLKNNGEKILNLNGDANSGVNPYWYGAGKASGEKFDAGNYERGTGDRLKQHIDELLRAFENNNLFGWLREEPVGEIETPAPSASS